MTNTIHYDINPDTLALLPARHTDYDTIVLERHKQYFVKKTAIKLLEEACLEGGSDYDGRRAAVTYKTDVQSKILIPVNPLEHIYAFPTHSPKLHECSWFFYHHIKSIKRHPTSLTESIITFKNYKELQLPISYHTLEKQMQRTSYCIVRFSHKNFM
jgi:competence protein ComK